MQYLKAKLFKIYHSDYFPFLVLAIGLIPVHFAITMGIGDDAGTLEVLDGTTLSAYLVNRYNTWSSRLVIEAAIIGISRFRLLWRACNIAVFVLIGSTISKLFIRTRIRETNWFITGMIFLYPFAHMGTAGWIATNLSYSWVLAFGLVSLIPVRKMLDGEKMRWFEYILYTASLIYAVNHEQMCAILSVTFLAFTIYFLVKKKVPPYLLVQLAICAGSMVFILTCIGNKVRNFIEVVRWFQKYYSLSFLQKVEIGFSSSLFEFVMKPNLIFTVFCALLLYGIFIKYKKPLYRAIAAVPFAASLMFGLFGTLTGEIFPGIHNVIHSMTESGTGIVLTSLKSFVPDILLAAVCLSALISIFLLFDDKKPAMLLILVISLGFGSRFMLAFSSMIWAAVGRTFLFMYFSFIIGAVMLYSSPHRDKERQTDRTAGYLFWSLVVLSIINNIMEAADIGILMAS